MNWLHRIGDAFDALRGRAPSAADMAQRSIAAGEVNRLLADWLGTRMTRDEELRLNMAQVRARARENENNDGVTRQFLRLLRVNVLGAEGPKLQAQVRNNDGRLNKPFNDRIEAAFADWCERPTRDGVLDMVEVQQLALSTLARDGELFVRKHQAFERNSHGFAIELVDPALVDETMNVAPSPGRNEIRMGIEVDADGRRVAYYLRPRVSAVASPLDRGERVPASEMLHLFVPEQVNQTRGVSWLMPVLVDMRMLSGYSEAALVAARAAAASMGFYQRRADASSVLPANQSSFITEANPGTFGVLPDGYELAEWSPNQPNTQFGEFIKARLRLIATGLGVTYNGLASDLEGTSYSSMRGGMVSERDVWRTLQAWWIRKFLLPLFRDWLNMALLHGSLTLDTRDARKFLAARFVPRGWAWVDPQSDTQATVEGIGMGLTSRRAALAEQGRDVEDVLEELAEETKLAAEYGVDISGGTATAAPLANDGGAGGGDATKGADGNGSTTN